ncbi:MAG: hypothetical protein AAGC81_10275 [Pseudomonadota bacterium]
MSAESEELEAFYRRPLGRPILLCILLFSILGALFYYVDFVDLAQGLIEDEFKRKPGQGSDGGTRVSRQAGVIVELIDWLVPERYLGEVLLSIIALALGIIVYFAVVNLFSILNRKLTLYADAVGLNLLAYRHQIGPFEWDELREIRAYGSQGGDGGVEFRFRYPEESLSPFSRHLKRYRRKGGDPMALKMETHLFEVPHAQAAQELEYMRQAYTRRS